MAGEEQTYCYYHPDVETSLRCSNCGKAICPKDMVYTPVGLKCRECGRPTRKMRGGAKPAYYVRAVLYGLAAAVGGGLIALEVRHVVRFGGILVALALGYFVGEAVGRAVHRRSDTVFQVIAGMCALLAGVVAGYLGDPRMLVDPLAGLTVSPMGLIYIALAVFMAVSRSRG